MPGSPQPTPGVSVPYGATVTILFSDIRGFTEYTERYGDAAALRVLRQHNTLVRNEIETFGGRVVKTQGDSFMVYFTTARAAILCAIAIQRAVTEATHDEPGTSMALGIGINTGEPIQEGGDFFGSTVNLAARICAAAGPGQILISETTRYVAGRIEAVEYSDQGVRELKGFHEAQRLFEISWAPQDALPPAAGPGTSELRAEMAALAERFGGLGADLVTASRAMRDSGPPPAAGLAAQAKTLRAAFADLRTRVLQRATMLGLAQGVEPESLMGLPDLDRVLSAIEEGEATQGEAPAAPGRRASREALEAAVQRAIGVLNRILVVTHRDDPAFQPLLECQAKASDLRLRLSRAVSQESDLTPPRVDEAVLPFADLTTLVVGREYLDDERFTKIEDTVTRSFGRPLAVAATRGRLFIEGAEPRVARPAAASSPGQAPPAEVVVPRAPAGERQTTTASREADAAPAPPPADPREAAVPWWAAASAAWRTWKSSGMATAHALRAVITTHPHLLAVPLRSRVADDEQHLVSGYFLLLEHVENISPGFVRTAIDHATEAAGGSADGAALEVALYQLLVARGRLRDTYPEFVRDVMIAAIPNPGIWLDGGVIENEESTVILRRHDPAIGAPAEQEEVLTEQKDRAAEHRFAVTLAPLTARFFCLKRGDVKESRDVDVKVMSGGEPSDDAWLLSLRSDHLLHAPPKRYTPSTGTMPGFGKNYSGLWIGVFNPDPEGQREFEVMLSVRPEARVDAARPSIFGARPR